MQNPKHYFDKFNGYSSIELSTNTKFIKNIHHANFNQPDILWVATEKIHGANFSIVYDFQTNLVKYGRRTDFITKQIPVPVEDVTPYFNENFFDSSILVNTFHNNLLKVKQNVQKIYEKVSAIQIYGEYFGGFWPGDAKCKKRVQPGVYYTADHQFMVFDIKLYGEEFNTWVKVIEIEEIVKNSLKCVPIHGKGTFDQIQRIQSQFDSTIPDFLGLQKLKNNISQGLILRPNNNLFSKNRVMLKKKNKQFLENAYGKKDPNKKNFEKQKSKNDNQVQLLETFLNYNRIESAISKYPDFQDQYHLKGYIVEDILSDAVKQGWKMPQNPKDSKEITKKIDKRVLDQIMDYLQTQRKQFAERIKKQSKA